MSQELRNKPPLQIFYFFLSMNISEYYQESTT